MHTFSYYFHHYWLSAVLILGTIGAIAFVYFNRDKLMIWGDDNRKQR
ncbi:hypothetical protein [Paenibacillus thalictri]|nr:hypothetical protein [Paenibacillus thalictri]